LCAKSVPNSGNNRSSLRLSTYGRSAVGKGKPAETLIIINRLCARCVPDLRTVQRARTAGRFRSISEPPERSAQSLGELLCEAGLAKTGALQISRDAKKASAFLGTWTVFAFYSPIMFVVNGIFSGLPQAWMAKCKKCKKCKCKSTPCD
jgi:hypothetical protein